MAGVKPSAPLGEAAGADASRGPAPDRGVRQPPQNPFFSASEGIGKGAADGFPGAATGAGLAVFRGRLTRSAGRVC